MITQLEEEDPPNQMSNKYLMSKYLGRVGRLDLDSNNFFEDGSVEMVELVGI